MAVCEVLAVRALREGLANRLGLAGSLAKDSFQSSANFREFGDSSDASGQVDLSHDSHQTEPKLSLYRA
jgi:hypothetical protein